MESNVAGAAPLRERLSAQQILDNVSKLGALIEAEADAVNAQQQLTDPVREAFRKAGVFRATFPEKVWGGPEMWIDDQIRMVESVAYHDASTAWNVMVLMDSGNIAPLLDPEAASELFPSIDLSISGSARPAGRAVKVDGGYKLTGRWSFGSGIRDADVQWGGFHLYADDESNEPELDARGIPAIYAIFVPGDQIKIFDTWQTTGLEGSGSTEYAVTDVLVPANWMYHIAQEDGTVEIPALARYGQILQLNGTGVPLGIARRAIDEFRDLVEKPTRTNGAISMKQQDPGVAIALGRAVALHDAASAYALTASRAVCERLFADESLSRDEEASLNLIPVLPAQMCREALELLMECLGARSVLAEYPFDRLYRDMSTVIRHGAHRNKLYEVAGCLMLDLEPGPHLDVA